MYGPWIRIVTFMDISPVIILLLYTLILTSSKTDTDGSDCALTPVSLGLAEHAAIVQLARSHNIYIIIWMNLHNI